MLGEAGLSTLRIKGARWSVEKGVLSCDAIWSDPHADQFHKVLMELQSDMTVAEFLQQHFAGQQYAELRSSIAGRVEGYDAADPHRASVLALRDEWMDRGESPQARIAGGYHALVDFLAPECRKNGVVIRLGSAVTAIEASDEGGVVHCANGDANACDAVILDGAYSAPKEIELPAPEREKAEAASTIGFGNVIKILLRFETRWWVEKQKELADLTFLFSDARVRVWWTQHPSDFPLLTGWLGGPRTEAFAHLDEDEMIAAGIASLAGVFGLDAELLREKLVTARAINWAKHPFARGAYSYATVETRYSPSCRSLTTAGFCFQARRSTGAGTWVPSRRRSQPVWQPRELFCRKTTPAAAARFPRSECGTFRRRQGFPIVTIASVREF